MNDCSVRLRVPPKGVAAMANLEASLSEVNLKDGITTGEEEELLGIPSDSESEMNKLISMIEINDEVKSNKVS